MTYAFSRTKNSWWMYFDENTNWELEAPDIQMFRDSNALNEASLFYLAGS